MNDSSSHTDRNLQFSLRSLLWVTLILGLDFAVLARISSSGGVMVLHLLIVQTGLLFACWMYYRFMHADPWNERRPRRGGLYQGLASAGAIYGGLLYTLTIAAAYSADPSVSTSDDALRTLAIAPVACLFIAFIGSGSAMVVGLVVDLLSYCIMPYRVGQMSKRAHATLTGGITGAVAPLLLTALFQASILSDLRLQVALLITALPALVGALTCYFYTLKDKSELDPKDWTASQVRTAAKRGWEKD